MTKTFMRHILVGPSNCPIKVGFRMVPQVHASLLNWVFPTTVHAHTEKAEPHIFSRSMARGNFQISDILALMPCRLSGVLLRVHCPRGPRPHAYFWSKFSLKALPDLAFFFAFELDPTDQYVSPRQPLRRRRSPGRCCHNRCSSLPPSRRWGEPWRLRGIASRQHFNVCGTRRTTEIWLESGKKIKCQARHNGMRLAV